MKDWWKNIQAMPSSLKGFTILMWVMGVLIVVASVIPGWTDVETGRRVPHAELWSRIDGGIMIFSIGLGMILLATMIYKGWNWVRHALMVGIAAIGLSGFIDPVYNDVPVGLLWAISSVTIGYGLYYFYFRSEVIAYFTKNNQA
jgi:hypothetical protein